MVQADVGGMFADIPLSTYTNHLHHCSAAMGSTSSSLNEYKKRFYGGP
jgi:hypothetical protein